MFLTTFRDAQNQPNTATYCTHFIFMTLANMPSLQSGPNLTIENLLCMRKLGHWVTYPFPVQQDLCTNLEHTLQKVHSFTLHEC